MTVTYQLQPAPGAHDVVPGATLYLTLATPDGTFDLGSLLVTVDGETAYADHAFRRPAFSGEASATSTLVAMAIRPRRAFLYGVKVDVTVSGTHTVGGSPLGFSESYAFYTRPAGGALHDPSLRSARVGRAFPDHPALETHRQLLIQAIGGTGGTAPVVALYRRMALSQLRAMSRGLRVAPAAAAELPHVHASDMGSVTDCDDRLRDVRALWEPALRELLDLGVSPADIQLIFRSGASDNAVERVGAACAAVLFAAERLGP